MKLCGNDYVVKFVRWFEILVFIGGYAISSVVPLFVIMFAKVWIVNIDGSVGAISSTYVIVGDCCDDYYEHCFYNCHWRYVIIVVLVYLIQ